MPKASDLRAVSCSSDLGATPLIRHLVPHLPRGFTTCAATAAAAVTPPARRDAGTRCLAEPARAAVTGTGTAPTTPPLAAAVPLYDDTTLHQQTLTHGYLLFEMGMLRSGRIVSITSADIFCLCDTVCCCCQMSDILLKTPCSLESL